VATASVIDPASTVDFWPQAEAITLASGNLAPPPPVPAINSISLSSLTAQANQSGQTTVGTISSTTTGATGAISYALADTGGNFILTNGNTVTAIAALPAGSFGLTVIATSASGASLSQSFTVVSA
jgi:hypothetical protein